MAQNEQNDISKLLGDPRTLTQLAQSSDARALMSLLSQGHDQAQLAQAAQSAMGGDMQALKTLMQSITNSAEGTQLLQRLHDSFRQN